MKKQLSSFCIHQTSKVLALTVTLAALLVCIPFGIYTMIHDHNITAGLFLALVVPFLVFILKYIIYAIVFFLYNSAASFVGGIRFDVDDAEK